MPSMPSAPGQQPPKGNALRIIMIIGVIVAILVLVLYIYVSVKHPDWLSGEEEPDGQPRPEPEDPDEEEGSSNAVRLILILGGLAGIVIVGYILIKGRVIKLPSVEPQKIPVPPDRAEALFIENFAKKYDVPSMYDPEKKVFIPCSPTDIVINDKIPYFHTPTGDNFLGMEIEVREGRMQGIHWVTIPIDKGEKVIKGGYYRIDTHTPKHLFQLNRNTFPMSSMIDKQDRLRLAELERMQEAGQPITPQISAMASPSPTSGSQISTPLDQYGFEAEKEAMQPTPQVIQAPPYQYPRRYVQPQRKPIKQPAPPMAKRLG